MAILLAGQLMNRCLIPYRDKIFITSPKRPVTSLSRVLNVVAIPGQKSYVNIDPIPVDLILIYKFFILRMET